MNKYRDMLWSVQLTILMGSISKITAISLAKRASTISARWGGSNGVGHTLSSAFHMFFKNFCKISSLQQTVSHHQDIFCHFIENFIIWAKKIMSQFETHAVVHLVIRELQRLSLNYNILLTNKKQSEIQMFLSCYEKWFYTRLYTNQFLISLI